MINKELIQKLEKEKNQDIRFKIRKRNKKNKETIFSVKEITLEDGFIYLDCQKGRTGREFEDVLFSLKRLKEDLKVLLRVRDYNFAFEVEDLIHLKDGLYAATKFDSQSNLDTILSFAELNGFRTEDDRAFIYIFTNNDRFKIPKCELLKDEKEVTLYHGHSGYEWHRQCNHKWTIGSLQRHIYNHDFKTHTNFSRRKILLDTNKKKGDIKYGITWV